MDKYLNKHDSPVFYQLLQSAWQDLISEVDWQNGARPTHEDAQDKGQEWGQFSYYEELANLVKDYPNLLGRRVDWHDSATTAQDLLSAVIQSELVQELYEAVDSLNLELDNAYCPFCDLEEQDQEGTISGLELDNAYCPFSDLEEQDQWEGAISGYVGRGVDDILLICTNPTCELEFWLVDDSVQ